MVNDKFLTASGDTLERIFALLELFNIYSIRTYSMFKKLRNPSAIC